MYENKVALLEQINRDIYNYDRIKSLRERISLFEKLNYIQRVAEPLYFNKKIVSLTLKGFNKFISPNNKRRIELKSNSVYHDLGLVDIRYYFQKKGSLTAIMAR